MSHATTKTAVFFPGPNVTKDGRLVLCIPGIESGRGALVFFEDEGHTAVLTDAEFCELDPKPIEPEFQVARDLASAVINGAGPPPFSRPGFAERGRLLRQWAAMMHLVETCALAPLLPADSPKTAEWETALVVIRTPNADVIRIEATDYGWAEEPVPHFMSISAVRGNRRHDGYVLTRGAPAEIAAPDGREAAYLAAFHPASGLLDVFMRPVVRPRKLPFYRRQGYTFRAGSAPERHDPTAENLKELGFNPPADVN